MYAWRYFSALIAIVFRKDFDKQKFQIKTSNEHRWRKMTQLANELEFKFFELKRLQTRNSNAQMIMNFFRQIRSCEYYNVSNELFQSSMIKILQILNDIQERKSSNLQFEFLARNHDFVLEIRCEKSHKSSHDIARSRFYYQNLYQTRAFDCFHFNVHRDIFYAFFDSNSLIDFSQSVFVISAINVAFCSSQTTFHSISRSFVQQSQQSQRLNLKEEIKNFTFLKSHKDSRMKKTARAMKQLKFRFKIHETTQFETKKMNLENQNQNATNNDENSRNSSSDEQTQNDVNDIDLQSEVETSNSTHNIFQFTLDVSNSSKFENSILKTSNSSHDTNQSNIFIQLIVIDFANDLISFVTNRSKRENVAFEIYIIAQIISQINHSMSINVVVLNSASNENSRHLIINTSNIWFQQTLFEQTLLQKFLNFVKIYQRYNNNSHDFSSDIDLEL